MDVQVFFTSLHHGPNPLLDEFANFLNEEDKRRAMAFHHAIDKYRFLAGRWLLQGWLTENNHPQNINSIRKDEYKRPLLDGLSFSISHSGDWVGLAATAGNQNIGLDIEENRQLEVKDYMLPFTPAEQQYILDDDCTNRFYRLWTRKEAVLKAIGRGFLSEPADTCVLENVVVTDGKELHIHSLETIKGYTIHFATETAGINRVKITLK